MAGAENMGVDEALMERARATGECVLRVYGWSRPTLSFGRNQLVRGRVDLERVAAAGVDVVRRPTGGRALLHHREVTYSVTAALGHGESVRAWYDWINHLLLDALHSLGVTAEPAVVEGRTPAPGTASCFKRPDAGEIAVDGRKLVGSALLRERDALLQHGSILLANDQDMLATLLPAGEAGGDTPASLEALLGDRATPALVGDALVTALGRRVVDAQSLAGEASLARGARLATARFASPGWTLAR